MRSSRRPLAAQVLQDLWLLRLPLSQSFVGAILLLGLVLKSRLDIGDQAS